MPNNTSNLQERMGETRATSEAQSVIRTLNDSIMDPSTKRFVKGRSSRIKWWRQLEEIAGAQAVGLTAMAKAAPKRKAPPSVPGTDVPIAHVDEAAARQTA